MDGKISVKILANYVSINGPENQMQYKGRPISSNPWEMIKHAVMGMDCIYA
jgi:hypothetical protein